MILLTLTKKFNQYLGPFLLRQGLRARYALGGGVLRDNPTLDALLLLPWSMKIISLEVYEEQSQLQHSTTTTAAATKDGDLRKVAVLERYLRSVLVPNEQWNDVRLWQFHSRFLRWVRSEFLWAMYGERVQTALLAFESPQLNSNQQQRRKSSAGRTITINSLPSSQLVLDAFDMHHWTNRKDWSATGRAMSKTVQRLGGGRVIELKGGSVVRFAHFDDPHNNTDLSKLSLQEILELAGTYVSDCSPLNALCEKRNMYQLWTREYVSALARYLVKRTQSFSGSDETVVLDVGAGDGLLAELLRESMTTRTKASRSSNPDGPSSSTTTSRKASSKVPTVIATDDGSWRISRVAPVEAMSVENTLAKYAGNNNKDNNCQVIVLCSWMPMNEDWSYMFRQARVHEYILIGECDDGQCGDNWSTWGNRQYLQDLDYELDAALSNSDDEEGVDSKKVGENENNAIIPRPYEADGYRRKDLDALASFQFSRYDCSVSKSGRTVSFRRMGE